jgi:hypothetical protein
MVIVREGVREVVWASVGLLVLAFLVVVFWRKRGLVEEASN